MTRQHDDGRDPAATPEAECNLETDAAPLTRKESSDRVLEERLGTILRAGVYASSICLAVGLLLDLTTGLSGASTFLMTTGLVMLLATPVARVAASVVQYAVMGDRLFFVLTSIVLAELAAGVVAALVFHRRL